MTKRKRTPSSIGRNNRHKGAQGEREVAGMAVSWGYSNAHRTAPMQAGRGGDYPDVADVGVYWVEVRRGQKVNVHKGVRECLKERPGYVPLLAWRNDGGTWMATMDLEDAIRLERMAYQRDGRGALEWERTRQAREEIPGGGRGRSRGVVAGAHGDSRPAAGDELEEGHRLSDNEEAIRLDRAMSDELLGIVEDE